MGKNVTTSTITAKKQKILIVDDTPENLFALEKVLADVDAEVIKADSGNDALKLTLHNDFAIAILDVQMPDMDGFELAEILRNSDKTRHLPIIFLSAIYSDDYSVFKGYESGGVDFITKPYNPAILLSKVNVFLQLNRQTLELQRKIELERSKNYLEDILRCLGDGIVVISLDGVIKTVNAAASRLLGRQESELTGASIDTVFKDKKSRGWIRRHIAAKKSAGGTRKTSTTLESTITTTGSTIPVLISCSPLYGGGDSITPVKRTKGQITHFIVVIRDITEQTNAKKREIAMGGDLHAVVEATDELIACINLEALFRRAVELARDKLGIDRCAIFVMRDGKVRGTYGIDVDSRTTDERSHEIPLDDVWRKRFSPPEPNAPKWQSVMEARTYWNGEKSVTISDGWVAITPIHASDSASPPIGVFVNDSMVTGDAIDELKQDLLAVYCSSVARIAEIKESEQCVREQAALLDITADAVMVLDLDNRIIYWNKGAERLYGYHSEEVIGMDLHSLISDTSMIKFANAKSKNPASGEWRTRMGHTAHDGRELTVESSCTLMLDEMKQPKSILLVNTDITDRVNIEQQLLRAQRIESIGTLAGGIAHDLNNVLAPILLSVQMLKLKLPKDAFGKILDVMESNAKRGGALVNQISTFARGAEGENQLLKMKRVLTEIKSMFAETLGNDITMEVNAPNDLYPIMGNPTQLHQAFLNLCVNAREAMPKGGRIAITAANIEIDKSFAVMFREIAHGSYIAVSVSDTGSGISDDVIGKIFEPFFTTKDAANGAGIGLATSLEILESHKGYIGVKSAVGEGTTVTVYLPAETDNQLEDTGILKIAALPRGHGELVLVVDDEASVREIVKETLECYGYRVVTAVNGAEAIGEMSRNKTEVALVLLDIEMPIMDGTTAIPAIKLINSDVKMILMSGVRSHEKVTNTIKSTINAFLTKPFTAEVLLTAMKEVLA